jgi:hypothetical protein
MTQRRLGVFVLAVLGATAGLAEAQAPTHEAILNAIGTVETLVRRVNRKVDGIQVTVVTNETVCTGNVAQCNGSGHTTAAAGSTNHNPVAIILLVTRNGEPILNLPASAFTFEGKFQPASAPGYGPCNDVVGGSSPPGDQVGCGPFTDSLFQDAGDGVYAFYVHPTAPAFNWFVGKYTFMVKVADGNDLGRGLGTFVIP